MRDIKRVFVFALCLLLLYTSAFAEKYEGINTFYLEREFDHWNLSETKRESVNGLERVVYTDAKDERRAELAYYEDAVCMVILSEVMCDSKYLEQMFQATMAGESGFVQVMASLCFESHMPTMEDCESYADNIGGMCFRLYRVGDIKGVFVVKDMDTVMALMAPSDASTPQPTATPTPTPTPKPTNTPEPTATPDPRSIRPGLTGTNAYDITAAMDIVGIKHIYPQSVEDGYRWVSDLYQEGNVFYNIEIESTKDYRITSMQILMTGGDNNFVQWCVECLMGVDSKQAEWLALNQWNDEVTTATFDDGIWTITPQGKGVFLSVQHVDAEDYYSYLLDKALQ